MKPLVLMTYNGKKVETNIDLEKMDDIIAISISVVSGDEIANVLFKDGHIEEFDADCLSDGTRIKNDLDGKYVIYFYNVINRIDKFNKREDTYAFFEGEDK